MVPISQASPLVSPSLAPTMFINLGSLHMSPGSPQMSPGIGLRGGPTFSFPQEPQASCDSWPCSCPSPGTEDPLTLVPVDLLSLPFPCLSKTRPSRAGTRPTVTSSRKPLLTTPPQSLSSWMQDSDLWSLRPRCGARSLA